MSKLELRYETKADTAVGELYGIMERRMAANPPGSCPVDLASAFLTLCHAQTCGKCVPCRVGLGQMNNIIQNILDGNAAKADIRLLEETAKSIYDTADCAIGYEAAGMVLKGLKGFKQDYENHAAGVSCTAGEGTAVPCVSGCPAHVDIPGYIALISAGRHADAIRLIRKDNPFPSVCGMICENPCESHCRRTILDYPLSIRGLKAFADVAAGSVPAPKTGEKTGKRVAVIGGGPSGLTAGYFLSLMGHSVTVFEKRKHLGGMLRYGIPNYRLPKERLDAEIDVILSTGIEVKMETDVGTDVSYADLRNDYDAIYISIGAHSEKTLGIEGENSQGVMSAVQMLRAIGDGSLPDFSGKKVVVVGGGNVAMDVARTSVRLGAAKVSVAYRRRQVDMTALPAEVEGAIAEGCEILAMQAPDKIETQNDVAVALWTRPQIVGPVEQGRPKPVNAKKDPVRVEADVVIVAVGQDIDSEYFAQQNVPVGRKMIKTGADLSIDGTPGVFSGGDCVSGPSTVIRSIEAGKIAARNIDEYFGFNHKISVDIEIPDAGVMNKPYYGRVGLNEREAACRKTDFELMEIEMSAEEAKQEAGRCLRCDKFGCGSFRGGRNSEW